MKTWNQYDSCLSHGVHYIALILYKRTSRFPGLAFAFPDVNKFYSHCRLVPGADNSNRNYRHKSGNKDGNKYLQMAFTEAGFRATVYYKEIKQYYQSKSRKKHKTIARILVAKELAKICYFILKEKQEYNHTFKGVKLSRKKSTQWPRLVPTFVGKKSGVVPVLYLGHC